MNVYDVVEDGRPFMVMELVHGMTLDATLYIVGPVPGRQGEALKQRRTKRYKFLGG